MKQSSKRKKHGRKKRLAIFLTFALFVSTLVVFLYSSFWGNKQALISPIASSGQNVTKRLEKLLLDSEIEFLSVTFRSPSSYSIKLKEDGEAILSLHKDFRNQITSLQAVLRQLTIEGKMLVRIDFRFDKPVIEINE